MFDKTIRELKALERGIPLHVQLPLDADGYLDRRCPSDVCQAGFKVLMEDWTHTVSDERVFCPVCREEARSTEWNTPKQRDHMRQVAVDHLQGLIGKALARDAVDFNRRQQPGFVTISLSVRPGTPSLIMPISAAEALRQRFSCACCRCRYSSLGAAFFCPACGHNSAESTFCANHRGGAGVAGGTADHT